MPRAGGAQRFGAHQRFALRFGIGVGGGETGLRAAHGRVGDRRFGCDGDAHAAARFFDAQSFAAGGARAVAEAPEHVELPGDVAAGFGEIGFDHRIDVAGAAAGGGDVSGGQEAPALDACKRTRAAHFGFGREQIAIVGQRTFDQAIECGIVKAALPLRFGCACAFGGGDERGGHRLDGGGGLRCRVGGAGRDEGCERECCCKGARLRDPFSPVRGRRWPKGRMRGRVSGSSAASMRCICLRTAPSPGVLRTPTSPPRGGEVRRSFVYGSV